MSGLPFELLLGLRYLRPKRTFVSVITLISVLGVMLGVAVLIIVISVMSGFDSELRRNILGFSAHLQVMASDPKTGGMGLMENYALVAAVVQSNASVTSVSPFAMGLVAVETERTNTDEQSDDLATMRGIDPENEETRRLFARRLEGRFDLDGHGLLVGLDFAEKMSLHVGDRVAVYSMVDLKKMRESLRRNKGKGEGETILPPRDFEVRGVFHTGFEEYDGHLLLCSLPNMQDLYGLDDDVHGLMVMLKDPYQADRVADELEQALGRGFYVSTWSQQSPLMDAVKVEKNVMYYILFFIVIVAAFGITCTLITFVVLKTRDIGVLKALGATGRQVMWIFLSQSLVVSVLGVLCGLTLGLTAVAYRNPFLHLMRRLTGMELFPAKIYMFTELPALIVPGDVTIICGGSLLICLLAAAFPAWHASRLKPVEALRHE